MKEADRNKGVRKEGEVKLGFPYLEGVKRRVPHIILVTTKHIMDTNQETVIHDVKMYQ